MHSRSIVTRQLSYNIIHSPYNVLHFVSFYVQLFYTYILIYTLTHACTHTLIHTYTHTHIHTHSGVNMYAMLVGKLPFRSPRQGSKRRQKLLEQISAGLADNHEKEMAHVSEIGRDLIARLLQPDPRRRVRLDHTMKHPWITKDGAQPLQPYRQPQPDPHTQHTVSQSGGLNGCTIVSVILVISCSIMV